MSTTTIDSSQIDGTEDGVLVLADIKAQMLNAENDMQLRPTYDGDSAITGNWTFEKMLTIDPNTALMLALNHPGLESGNTAINKLLLKAGPANEYSALMPHTDGVDVPLQQLAYTHGEGLWKIGANEILHKGNLVAGDGISIDAGVISDDYTVSNLAPSGTPDEGHIWYRTL